MTVTWNSNDHVYNNMIIVEHKWRRRENILLRDCHTREKSQVPFGNKYYYLPKEWIFTKSHDFTETVQLETDEHTRLTTVYNIVTTWKIIFQGGRRISRTIRYVFKEYIEISGRFVERVWNKLKKKYKNTYKLRPSSIFHPRSTGAPSGKT